MKEVLEKKWKEMKNSKVLWNWNSKFNWKNLNSFAVELKIKVKYERKCIKVHKKEEVAFHHNSDWKCCAFGLGVKWLNYLRYWFSIIKENHFLSHGENYEIIIIKIKE